MKKLLLLTTAVCALLGTECRHALAQEVVTTGMVQVMGKDGTLTVRSDQTSGPVTFYGVEKTNIFMVDGKAAMMDDLTPGTKVTVQYAVKAGKWYVAKIMLDVAPKPMPMPVTGAGLAPVSGTATTGVSGAAVPLSIAPAQPVSPATPFPGRMPDRTGQTASPDGKTGGKPVAGVRAP